MKWARMILHGQKGNHLENIFDIYKNDYLQEIKFTDLDLDLIALMNCLLAYLPEKRRISQNIWNPKKMVTQQ